MAEKIVAYKCPGCGSIIPDEEDKVVLTCPHCGNTITKVQNTVDKVLKYKERRDIRKDEKEKEDQKRADKALKWCGVILVLALTALYLMEKGIL